LNYYNDIFVNMESRMGFLDKTKEAMDSSSILEKSKGLSDKAKDKVSAFDGDTLIADAVMKAVEKQEKVN